MAAIGGGKQWQTDWGARAGERRPWLRNRVGASPPRSWRLRVLHQNSSHLAPTFREPASPTSYPSPGHTSTPQAIELSFHVKLARSPWPARHSERTCLDYAYITDEGQIICPQPAYAYTRWLNIYSPICFESLPGCREASLLRWR